MREKHDRLPARSDAHVIRVDPDAAGAGNVGGDDLTKFREPALGPYLVQPSSSAFFARLHDVRGSREIGFADLQVNDVFPLLLESTCPYEHFKCRFGPEPGHFFGKLHFFAFTGFGRFVQRDLVSRRFQPRWRRKRPGGHRPPLQGEHGLGALYERPDRSRLPPNRNWRGCT